MRQSVWNLIQKYHQTYVEINSKPNTNERIPGQYLNLKGLDLLDFNIGLNVYCNSARQQQLQVMRLLATS